jgi:hypothetical protein
MMSCSRHSVLDTKSSQSCMLFIKHMRDLSH